MASTSSSSRPQKLAKLNSLRRACPFATQSALEAVLSHVKEHGMPELKRRKDMLEARRSHLASHNTYGELLVQVPVVLHSGAEKKMWVVNGLSLLAGAFGQGGSWASMLSKTHAENPSTYEVPWGLALYTDEVMPGNSLAHRQERKCWVIYGSLCPFKNYMSCEDAWLLLAVIRSSSVNEMQSGIGQVMGKVLEQFFCNPCCNPQNGLLLQHQDDPAKNVRLFLSLSMFLMDGGAMKYTLNSKGDGGSKFCLLCCNCRAPAQQDMEDEDMLGSDVSSLSEIQLATDAEVLQAFQTRKVQKATMSKGDFAMWETAVGISYNQHGLLMNEKLLALSLLQPVTQYCHDWMHGMCSQGVMQVTIFLLLDTLEAWDLVQSFLALWVLPAATAKAGKLSDLFTSKRIKGYKEASKLKCTASECLGLCPLLAYMVTSVFVPQGLHLPACYAFLALATVLEMLQATPSGTVQPAQLQQEVERALALCKEAGWGSRFLRKHHWALHFATALGRWGFLPSCWATERKHKLITRYATATTNLTAFDRSILEECLSHDLLNLQSSTSFMVGAGLLSPHPATKKVHAFACMCLQEARLPAAESTQTSLFARLRSGGSCKTKDFVLVQCHTSPGWQVAQVQLHFDQVGICFTILCFYFLKEYCRRTSSAIVEPSNQNTLLHTSDILQAVVATPYQSGQRVLIPWQFRPRS